MRHRILTTRINAAGIVTLRNRARNIADIFGLDTTQRTRFVTAVSEIARNTAQYAGEGSATFFFEAGPDRPQAVIVELADTGPGIADIAQAIAGLPPRTDGSVRVGIPGTRKLVDQLEIACPPEGGTVVTLGMELPRSAPRLGAADLAALVDQLARRKPQGPLEELEQQNREMLQALAELRARQDELLKHDERKNQFLTTLAHELRNPMATIHMSLEILRKSDMTPLVAKRREIMSRQVDQLIGLVDEILDVARVSRGKVELQREALEVNTLVGDALEIASAAVTARQHQLTFAPSSGELWIQGDPRRLRQVVSNLVHNSARYSPEGGRIRVSVRREGEHAVIDVEDNGIGIAPDVLPHVFDMFVQGATENENRGGLGVGLTLVRRLVEDHGGSVSAASPGLGQGSAFCVILPLAMQEGQAQRAQAG